MVAGVLETVLTMGTMMLFTVFLWIMVVLPGEGLTQTAWNTPGVA
jgi:hypothetical protein